MIQRQRDSEIQRHRQMHRNGCCQDVAVRSFGNVPSRQKIFGAAHQYRQLYKLPKKIIRTRILRATENMRRAMLPNQCLAAHASVAGATRHIRATARSCHQNASALRRESQSEHRHYRTALIPHEL